MLRPQTKKTTEDKDLAEPAPRGDAPAGQRYYEGRQGMPPDELDDEGNLSMDLAGDEDDEQVELADFDVEDEENIESLPRRRFPGDED